MQTLTMRRHVSFDVVRKMHPLMPSQVFMTSKSWTALRGGIGLVAGKKTPLECTQSTFTPLFDNSTQPSLIARWTTPPGAMSQADVDAFVLSAVNGELTPEGVVAATAKGLSINGRNSGDYGRTALHWAVERKRRELVVALLAAGGDANIQDNNGWTSVYQGAYNCTADILQLLIDGGGNVKIPNKHGETPLIALVRWNSGDAAARLGVLLSRPEIILDAKYVGKTAEQWAVAKGRASLAEAIVAEVGLQMTLWLTRH